MKNTITIIIIFIIALVIIAFIFSLFLQPTTIQTEKIRYNECVLLQNQKTNEVDCFGCYNNICKDAEPGWELYQKNEIGIPYACFESDQGCQLAQ